MGKQVNIDTWVCLFIAGAFEGKDRETQIEAGWYDWFCKETSLAKKTKRMGNIIKKFDSFKKDSKIDFKNWYVWFKNNCPVNGPLFDDFRFADMKTGEVQFTVQLDCCWNQKKYAVFGRTPDGKFHAEKPLFETDSIQDLVNWFNEPWEH